VGDSANPVYDIVTVLKFDDETTIPVKVLGSQNFDNPENLKLPGSSWLWSGMDYYTWEDWTTGVTSTEYHSDTTSFWLPADVNWTGAAGTMDGAVDDTSYIIRFWYKGQLEFNLYLGKDLKYDLVNDPEGVVPETATANKDGINWMLDAADWTQFTYIYKQGSWLADSGITDPTNVGFDFTGILKDTTLAGYIDDVFLGMIGDFGKPDDAAFTLSADTLSVTIPPLGIRWPIPAAEDWTKMTINWTNPSGDIGGNLTMFVDNNLVATPDYITPDKSEFDPENAGWTFFDDFVYKIAEPTGFKPLIKKELHIYPNPAVDVIYFSTEVRLSRIDIFNGMGQLVKTINAPDKKFNISDLSQGMYMLNGTDESGAVYKTKFIKK